MNILLDTHVYLWVRMDDDHLPSRFRSVISDPVNAKYVSSLTAAEIAVKRSVGKLSIEGDFHAVTSELGLEELSFTHRHAAIMETLPLKHRDPFDRMLISQAIADDLVFLTVDKACMEYDVALLHEGETT